MDSCIILGMQRTGNHLVMRLLDLLGIKEHPNSINIGRDNIKNMPLKGYYCFGSHLPFCESSLLKVYKGIYISRDLRSVAHSNAMKMDNKLPYQDRIMFVTEQLKKNITMHQWKDHESVLHITFEKLIGPTGGGSDEKQDNEIKKICQFLNIDLTDKLLAYAKVKLFGVGEQFRKGTITDWRSYFDESFGEIILKIGEKNEL